MPMIDGAAAAATMQSWRTNEPGLCLKYTWDAYAAHGATSDRTYPTALSAWNASPQQHPGDWDPPLGVPVYLGTRAGSDSAAGAGDVFISLGGGRGVGTDWPGWGTIGEFSIQQRIAQTGRPYLGWTGDILGNPIIQGQPAATIPQEDDMKLIWSGDTEPQVGWLIVGPAMVGLRSLDDYNLFKRVINSDQSAAIPEHFLDVERDTIAGYLDEAARQIKTA